MERPTKIVILSSHTVLRESLRLALSKLDRFEIVCQECVELCHRDLAQTDEALLLVDVNHPVPSLLDLLRNLGADQRSAKIILMGVDLSLDSEGLRFLEMDADGSLPLDASLDEMIDAIDRVLTGEKIYPPSIAFLLYQMLEQKSREQDLRQRLDALALTPRELEILRCVAERLSNEDIASRLQISIHTVKNHVHNILEKLQVENRTTAAELACQKGWLESAEPTNEEQASGRF